MSPIFSTIYDMTTQLTRRGVGGDMELRVNRRTWLALLDEMKDWGRFAILDEAKDYKRITFNLPFGVLKVTLDELYK